MAELTKEERNKRIFNLIKREGECYHDWDRSTGAIIKLYILCKHCNSKMWQNENPSFFPPYYPSKWEAFGFIWERLPSEFWTDLSYYDGPHILELIDLLTLVEALEEWMKDKAHGL